MMHLLFRTVLLMMVVVHALLQVKAAINDGCKRGDKCWETGQGDRNFDDTSSKDQNGKVGSRRYKRSLNIPNPSTFLFELDWSIPITNTKGLTNFKIETDFSFDLTSSNFFKSATTTTAAPTTTSPTSYSSYASNRIETIAPTDFTRLDLYKHMEKYLERKGYNGEECTLRTLCEFAEAPFEHGIYGEMINMIMSASLNPSQVGGYDKYMTAEYYGKHYGDCGKVYPQCEHSVLDLFSKKF